MPRKNEYTFVVERPMSHTAAMRNARLFAELFLKQNGFTADISIRELRPGEEPHPIQHLDGIQSVG